jgi:hypothetical protein
VARRVAELAGGPVLAQGRRVLWSGAPLEAAALVVASGGLATRIESLEELAAARRNADG